MVHRFTLGESNYGSVVASIALPRCVGKGGKQCPGREAEQSAGEYLVTAECVA